MHTIHKLEEHIMETWRIIQDLKTITEVSEASSIDQMQNMLIGITQLYEFRFSAMFEEFEILVKEHFALRNKPSFISYEEFEEIAKSTGLPLWRDEKNSPGNGKIDFSSFCEKDFKKIYDALAERMK